MSVVASEPGKIFDREAMNAVRTWKYPPKVRGVERPGLRVRLDSGMGEG